MSLEANLVAANRSAHAGIIAGAGTRLQVLIDETPGGVQLPDYNLAAQAYAVTRGGCRVIGGQVSSTDAVAASLLIWHGQRRTVQDAGQTGAMGTTASTITRATGDFHLDGWQPGDAVAVHGPAGDAQRAYTSGSYAYVGVIALVTAVTGTTLTVHGTPFVVDTLQTGARLVCWSQRTRKAVAANAGNADATAPTPLLGGSQDVDQPAQPNTGLQMGAADLLAVSVAAAVSALPARLSVSAQILLY